MPRGFGPTLYNFGTRSRAAVSGPGVQWGERRGAEFPTSGGSPPLRASRDRQHLGATPTPDTPRGISPSLALRYASTTWQQRRAEGASGNREVPGGGGQQFLNPGTPAGYGRLRRNTNMDPALMVWGTPGEKKNQPSAEAPKKGKDPAKSVLRLPTPGTLRKAANADDETIANTDPKGAKKFGKDHVKNVHKLVDDD
ncbi:expressed unknown protein [Ectocarpus siliculosus]|uniref:Uncharacterized protein n=1 Tax=Ectocarpus siliculosus TaxID=2880 RepID=D7FP31_ECTSI|nr:expressed unknown protein [Ectocarpus siliculosus]|eukprot:CBJ30295.1 expressed unknown protein [Ectocarpus siliculosus]